MKYVPLGTSGLEVSNICLGSMTWGTQNTQADADSQIAHALSENINFIDTAEMYSIPPNAESYGKTESIIGDWFSRNQSQRGDVILASKMSAGFPYIRDGAPFSGATVSQAVDASLKRLKTDYIDLYQLHWSNRPTPAFGRHWHNHVRPTKLDPKAQTEEFLDILEGLNDCVKAGKIRHCGLSNETPWGLSKYLELAKEHNLPRMVSVQNEFSLVQTLDWPHMLEHCSMENVAYLPWSPLAAGMLSGKYIDGARPEGSRWAIPQRMGLFRDTELANEAVKAYGRLASELGVTPSQLALAWVAQIDGVSSTIIGATTLEQLKENISAFEIEFTRDMHDQVMQILKQYPKPF